MRLATNDNATFCASSCKMPKKVPLRGADAAAGVVNDSRFSSMHNAPIFKKVKKDSNKITVDERFQTVLTDDRFRAVPGTIDIYGRKSKKSTKAAAEKELNSFYQIEDNSAPDDDAAEHSKATGKKSAPSHVEASRKPTKADGLKPEDPETRLEYLNRLARGDVSGSSSDESDDGEVESDTDDSDGEGALTDDRSGSKHVGPLDIYSDDDEEGDGEEAHATCRLALMNCDWDNLKATDLLSVLQSFCPTGKTVKSVIVYPSDYGKEKMANEATHGPPKIWLGSNDDSDFEEADDGTEGDEEDEGYDGIEAIDQEDVPVPTKKGDKWKRNTSEVSASATKQLKPKISKSDRKGDFKRLPGTVGIVLQDDLVVRGKSRDVDVGDDEEDSEGEGAQYFDGDLSTTKVAGKNDAKGNRSQPRNSDKIKTMERERFTGAGKGDEDGEGGFDEVALRAYELSKLKYYFAVATLSCVETAETLMTQLDGVELGHSSMIFDLRYVPEDTSFEGRDVRDQSFEIGMDYQPPDFVVNALQHTTVQCSWDEGEKDRERKLTNISQWRQLQESELLQYVASSDSDDEEEDEEEEEEDGDVSYKKASASKGRTKQSAANLRRLLLGAGSDNEFSEDSDDERHSAAPKRRADDAQIGGEGSEDDFFMDDEEIGEETGKPRKATSQAKRGDVAKDESDMTFTYVPDTKKLQGRAEERDVDETPFESMQRKLAEKRKSRKAAKKLVKSALSTDDGEVASIESRGKKATKVIHEQVAATKAELELLLSDDDADYDMRALHKEEQDLLKGSKGKRKSRSKKAKEPEDAALLKDSTSASGGDFTLDLQDSRFARLLEGDSSFGIDRTSADFKESKAMKQIFGEQRNRREKGEALETRSERKLPDVVVGKVRENVDDLVSKLKRKYADQGNSNPKQARL